ncbi:MAG: ComEA family DNA-binding protein [Firmicutes bacterium]|nr:ComEA family DNA-binding protein [Bacillota bacterium]
MEHIKKYWHILVGCLCVVVLGAVYLIRDNSPAAQPNHERLLVASGENTQIAQTEPSEPLQSQQSEPIAETVENPVEIPVETLAETPIEQVPQNIVVHITGEVTNPGVYTIPADFRINDLLELAGGATDDADLSLINLAAFLQDAQQIVVPAYGDEFFTPEIPQTSQTAAVTQNTGQNTGQNTAQNTGLVNINTADATQLTTLPGIGATIANNIIAHREANGFFTSIEQLQNVPRIGATTFSNLRDLITVG